MSYRKRKEIVQVKVTISLRGDPQQQSNDHIAVVTICGASLTTRHTAHRKLSCQELDLKLRLLKQLIS